MNKNTATGMLISTLLLIISLTKSLKILFLNIVMKYFKQIIV